MPESICTYRAKRVYLHEGTPKIIRRRRGSSKQIPEKNALPAATRASGPWALSCDRLLRAGQGGRAKKHVFFEYLFSKLESFGALGFPKPPALVAGTFQWPAASTPRPPGDLAFGILIVLFCLSLGDVLPILKKRGRQKCYGRKRRCVGVCQARNRGFYSEWASDVYGV